MTEAVVIRGADEGRTLLVGEYEFIIERDGELETVVHTPAGLEDFFEEFGLPVARVGEKPDGAEAPDPAAMDAALERNGIRILSAPRAA